MVMKKRARSVVSIVCAVLCVAVVVAWVRGYFVSETVGFGLPRPGGTLSAGGFMSGRGGLGFAVVKGMPYDARIDGFFYQREPAGYVGGLSREPARWSTFGFMYIRLPTTSYGTGWAVAAPMWSLLLVLAPWPALHLRSAWRDEPKRRRRLGLCVRCGYDLRASADRCPECGEAKPAVASPGPPDGAAPAVADARTA